MFKLLHKTKDKTKNNELVNVINSGLKDLKKEIEVIPKKERENEKLDKIVKIVEDILIFNEQ